MGKIIKISFLILITLLTQISFVLGQEQCQSTILGKQYLENHPENINLRQVLNSLSSDFTLPELNDRTENIIPVVVHIIYDDNIPETQLSLAQIQSQIDVLNKDFNAINENIENVPEEFIPFISSVGLEFKLANVDPEGNPTNGITRDGSSEIWGLNNSIDNIKQASTGGADIWDANIYLNIWVGNLKPNILGYGTMPGLADPDHDGVIIGYQYFGNTGTAVTMGGHYNKGKTAVHEIGHYLNLEHLWGANLSDCNSDDEVTDTPLQYTPTSGCPASNIFSCGSNDMYVNFMDYSYDTCLLMFTEGQRLRMLATLTNFRDQLINSSGYVTGEAPFIPHNTTFKIYPNPARNIIVVNWNKDLYFEKIIIQDLYGKVQLIHSIQNKEEEQIDISSLQNGIYILSLWNELGTMNKKISIFH